MITFLMMIIFNKIFWRKWRKSLRTGAYLKAEEKEQQAANSESALSSKSKSKKIPYISRTKNIMRH